jgi:hypothetical protein
MSAPDLHGQKLGVLITRSSSHSQFPAVVALIKEALSSGVLVYLYCIHDGVLCINTKEIQLLKEQGVNLFGCAYGARKFNVPIDDAAAYAGLGSLSDIIANTDRFLSF